MTIFLSIVLIFVLGLLAILWSSESPEDEYGKGPHTGARDDEARSRWFL